jgi:chromosome partitioning protein
MTVIIAVVNLKGGAGKTTSAAFLGHALHDAGLRTIGVDADGENESLLKWQAAADWPFPVIGQAVTNMHKSLPGILGEKWEAVCIDTPPMKSHRGVVVSAVRLATHVVIPMAPSPMEFERLAAVEELVTEAADLRPSGLPPALAVLLTRCVPNAASTGVYREQTESRGLVVLKAQINRLERYSQAYGDPITGALNTAYGDAATELLDMEVPA